FSREAAPMNVGTALARRVTLGVEQLEDRLVLSDSGFIAATYVDILNRTAGQSEIQGWLNVIAAGGSHLVVATAIWQSPEHRGIQVDGYYQTYLHRASDPIGRNFWVAVFLRGTSEEDVQRGFMESTEFMNAHTDNTDFVNELYRDVLGRAGEPAGVAFWVGQLPAVGGRDPVIRAFLGSTERATTTIDGFYTNFLKRTADPAGEAFWLNAVQTGVLNLQGVGENILASREFDLLNP